VLFGEKKRLFFCCLIFTAITLLGLTLVSSFAYADIIIDNGGSDTSYTGVWGSSGGSFPYGADSDWSRDGATYTWNFSSQPAGTYRVHMWWSAWPSRASSINVSINHTGGPTSVVINQKVNAGQWNSLGEYTFGTSGSVTITAAYGSTVSTCADAVWFEYISGDPPPAEVIIDNDSPGTSYSGGLWGYSSGANPYGGSSRAEMTAGSTYIFQGSVTGYQEVSLWWTYWSSRCTGVPVDIYDGTTLLDTVQVNQHLQNLAGTWNVLGTYPFSGAARVVIRAQNGCSACADAVRLVGDTPPEMVDVPDVVGLSQSDAETMVTGAGLLVGNVTMASSNTVPEGNVISQSPTAGTSVPDGSAVDLVVSTGEQSGAELIIDNDGPGTSYSGGLWGYSSGANPYGGSSRAESSAGATYTFQGSVTGYQEISLWWTYWSSRCSDVPVAIYDGTTLLDTVQVNQRLLSLAGKWNVLGTYLFSGTARVVIRAQGGCSSCADAVKFTPAQGNPSIVIDNRDFQISKTGTWTVSGASNPYNPVDPDADSFYSRDGTTFKWHFTPLQSGIYDVSMWWTEWPSRSTSIPVNIEHGAGTATVYINQQEDGGQLNIHVEFYFQAGTTYDITITSQPGPSSTCADAVKFSNLTADGQFVKIATPLNYHLQTASNLVVRANAGNLEPTWKIKFVMDLGTSSERSIIDSSEPYEVVFTGVTKKEHTLDGLVIDGSNLEVPGTYSHDQVIQVGIGNYYVAIGDSITEGYGDDDPSDDMSLDGRNAGGGYTPILNNLLTAATGMPHTIVNEGVSGRESLGGMNAILTYLAKYPDSKRFLVQYGTNDSDPFFPVPSGIGLSRGDPGYPGTFKENMQVIVDEINADGKEVCLSKLPITLGDTPTSTPYANPDLGLRSVLIKEYNDVIDELKNDLLNDITVIPPDLYSLFNEDVPGGKRYDFEYYDNLHPNGEGYRSMAYRWLDQLAP